MPVGDRPKCWGWSFVWNAQRDRLASVIDATGSRNALDCDHPLARL
jgi:hypothetical protein